MKQGLISKLKDFLGLLILGKKVNLRTLICFVGCQQMQKRIEQIVMDSFGTQFYSKAMDCLKVLREQSIKVISYYGRVFVVGLALTMVGVWL